MVAIDKTEPRPKGYAIALVAVTALALGLVLYGSEHHRQWVWRSPTWNIVRMTAPAQPLRNIAPTMGARPPASPGGSSSAVAWVLIVLGLAVVALICFFAGRWMYRLVRALIATRLTRVPASDRLSAGITASGAPLSRVEVADAVEEALARLDVAATPTDAVIVAWLALEQAAGRHGLTRDPAQTPTEFAARLLEHSAVPAPDVRRLRALYSRARFSELPTTARDVGQARKALEHIARVLEEDRAI